MTKKNVKSVDKYEGHNVYDAGSKVSFGCGSVEISKKVLNDAATVLEDKKFKESLKILRKLCTQSGRSFHYILVVGPTLLRGLALTQLKR